MSNFNWQTDDDVNWDDLEPVRETAVPRRHPWVTYVLIVVGVITAATLIYRQVNQRIETATANTTSDILASHNLVMQASEVQDTELFNTLLSGRDFNWVDAQSRLVRVRSLYDRTALDLIWQPAAQTAVSQNDVDNGTVTIELNPELTAAELTFPQAYAVNVGNGVTETVMLQQTAVYRLGSQRWLYAPPDDEFWGGVETITGEQLRLTYLARDGELAQRLAFDLEAKLAEMCRSLADLNCPGDFRLNVRLHNDPQLLIDINRVEGILANSGQIDLPAPTLVGLPLDEAGYQALYRGYAAQLVSAAVAELTRFNCCQHLAYFQALLAYQLDELGLRPFPADRIDYARVVGENITIEELDSNWRSRDNLDGEAGWLTLTAVDYLRQQLPDVPIVTMQRQMQNSPQFANWLALITVESPEFNRDLLEQQWGNFAFKQYQTRLEPPPLPLPTQDIYLFCSPGFDSSIAELYRYRLANSEIIQQPFDHLAFSINPLPDDSSFLFLDSRDDMLRTFLWQDGPNQLLLPDQNQTITLGQFDPTGQYVQAYNLTESIISRIDWAACLAGNCTIEPLGGYPVWSPQGTDFILLPAESLGYEPFVVNGRINIFDPLFDTPEWPLYRGSGQPPASSPDSLTYLGTGYSPFWLDESTFGFMRQVPGAANNYQQELILMTTTDELPQTVLSQSELQSALPEDGSFTGQFMRYAVPHPRRPGLLFIVATGNERSLFIFTYDLPTNDLQFLMKTELGDSHSLDFSPDGRYLIVTGPEDGQQPFYEQRSDVFLYDLQTDQVQTFAGIRPNFEPSSTYDWSANGHWLAILQENQTIALMAPAYDYQQFIPHNLGYCSNVVWLNQ